jgi:hypothetical protein
MSTYGKGIELVKVGLLEALSASLARLIIPNLEFPLIPSVAHKYRIDSSRYKSGSCPMRLHVGFMQDNQIV